MSVLIKGIDKCISCEFCIYAESVPYTPDSRSCIMTGEYTYEKYGYIPNKCPMTELPEKHGRLIDGDYLADRLKALGLKDENVFRIIKEEPTVIESEE